MCNLLTISFLVLATSLQGAMGIWCFECVSTQPGCGTPFNYWFLWSNVCEESNDVCIKIIERRGADKVITRSCLSKIKAERTDIPADSYEGCRPAAKDLKLGHYVNNSIKELDIHRDYYDSTEYCFCFLDHRCNGSSNILPSALTLLYISIAGLIYRIFQ